jgi:hypothetical protein
MKPGMVNLINRVNSPLFVHIGKKCKAIRVKAMEIMQKTCTGISVIYAINHINAKLVHIAKHIAFYAFSGIASPSIVGIF